MKVQELFEAKGHTQTSDLVKKFNEQESGSVFMPLDWKDVGMRVWTRGDGTRYRDPGSIFLDRNLNPKDIAAWKKKKPVDKFWAWLKTQPGAKPVGSVSGEFGSSKMREAIAIKDTYYALTDFGTIEWGSTSRFRNKRSVWRHEGSKEE